MTDGDICEKILKGLPMEVYEKIIRILHVPITTVDYPT